MSATLGEGGELERITGVEKMSRLPIPQGWQKQEMVVGCFFFQSVLTMKKILRTYF
ncbi:MAG: hypothetical protein AAFR77_06490 [Cyanobacteria bacterium J06631_2]